MVPVCSLLVLFGAHGGTLHYGGEHVKEKACDLVIAAVGDGMGEVLGSS